VSLHGVCGKQALRQVPPPAPDISVHPVSVTSTGAPYSFFRLSPRLDTSAVDSVYIPRNESGGGYQKSEEHISSIVRVEVSHLQVTDNRIHKPPLTFHAWLSVTPQMMCCFPAIRWCPPTTVQHCAVRKSDDYRRNCRPEIESR